MREIRLFRVFSCSNIGSVAESLKNARRKGPAIASEVVEVADGSPLRFRECLHCVGKDSARNIRDKEPAKPASRRTKVSTNEFAESTRKAWDRYLE